MQQLLDIFRDIPGFLEEFTRSHGPWIYAVLFAVVFCETGLVITPFLPGDSLFFAVGALCATGVLKLHIAAPALFVAAVLGNTTNYWIGKYLGPRIFRGESVGLFGRLMSRKHLERAHQFYEKHGAAAVILGQFLPIVRTFVPFVAGAGAMNYARFILFNIIGAFLWVSVCVGAGLLFGNIPFVRHNFEYVIIGIIGVSIIPVIVQVLRARFARKPVMAGAAAPSEPSESSKRH
ncbi:MAG: VTT domain-containing protein [Phycisphaerales bacterium]